MPSLSLNIPNDSDVAKQIKAEVMLRVKQWDRVAKTKFTKWQQAEEKALAYLPEGEIDAVKRAQRDDGNPQYTTIQVPYSYAVVMSAYTYLTSVFCGRDPMFQYTGRHGESQQAVMAVEALVGYQVQMAQMVKYIHTWLYDGLKYGEGIIGCWWDERFETITSVTEMQDVDELTGLPAEGSGEKVQQSQVFRSYAGNRLYNIQPQSFIWDTRYPMREFQSGEFAGERKKISWNEAIRGKAAGYLINIEKVQRTAQSFYGDLGSSQLDKPEAIGSFGFGSDIEVNPSKRPTMFGVYRLVMEIVPDDYRFSKSKFPEKWVFTVTDDFSTLVGVQPLGAYHCKFPYSVIPFEPEGYGLTTRGLPEILEPVQNTVDWLINTHFHNVRASLNNQFLVDPSRVVMKDLMDPLPGGIIRLKPGAYGQDPKTALSQLPVADATRNHIADFSTMIGIGERIGGVNDQIMGMLNTGGGRKTATEVRTSTSFGINRLKTTAEFASACGFDPLSQIIVSNSQQYYDMELQFKIAGDQMANAGPGFLMVRPEDIVGFYNFVPVDGTLPIDRQGQVALWERLMQTGFSVPQIGMGYDWQGIFQWVAQLAGLKNISQFKVQIQPDAMLAAQAQAGNSVPMGGKPAGLPDGKSPGAQFSPGMSAGPGAM